MAKKYKQKPGNGKVTIDLPGDAYIISEEINDNGVVTLICVPTDQQKKEFESQLNSILAEIDAAQLQRTELTARISELQAEKNDLQKIIDTL